MAIGTSKIGVLGGGVDAGSTTFNASGTFSVPPGVTKVYITGKGGAGNPGNSGTSGNTGTSGNDGAGGAGGNGSWRAPFGTPNRVSVTDFSAPGSKGGAGGGGASFYPVS